jgi:hypothetical protein
MYKIITVIITFVSLVIFSLAVDQVLTWGRLLNGIVDWLDLVLYVVLALVFLFYLVLPILKWRAYPTPEVLAEILGGPLKPKKRLLRQIQRHTTDASDQARIAILRKSNDEKALDDFLKSYYIKCGEDARAAAKDTATKCFAVIAANQNSVLDSVMIIIFNVSMIQRIYSAFRLRDSFLNIARYYRTTVLQASVTGLFESLDDEIIEILSSRSAEMLRKIPFADVVMSSILQGFANGYMTYYYGYLSILSFERTLFETDETDVDMRRRARRDTRNFMMALIGKPLDQLAKRFKPSFDFGRKKKDVPEDAPLE